MAVVRRNVLADSSSRESFIRGIKLLKNEETGLTTDQFGISGPINPVYTYDLFVIWHIFAMSTPVPPGGNPGDRNVAHRGPAFLPWHRAMLIWLELHLQRILDDADFGLPYWDWAADGTPTNPGASPAPEASHLWLNTDDFFGGQGSPIQGGAFAFDPQDANSFRVRIAINNNGFLRQIIPGRGLSRIFGDPLEIGGPPTELPQIQDVFDALNVQQEPHLGVYDCIPFNDDALGFRNRLEGFTLSTPDYYGLSCADGPISALSAEIPIGLHNLVHVWVSGDMGPAHSPNDPIFFLHHCNVDRIWESWMSIFGRVYVPDMTASQDLLGHRIEDPLVSPFDANQSPTSISDVLDVANIYSYDHLINPGP